MALARWVDFFEDLQNVRGRSQNTVMAYRRDLELYDEFKQKHSDIQAIYDFLKKNGLSTRSQARVISSIRTYLKFCQKQGDDVSDLRSLRPPRVKLTLPKPITTEDFYKLLDGSKVEDAFKTARNHITLYLLFGLGCRVSELVDMTLRDFMPADGVLIVTGKGNKQRMIPLTSQLQKDLSDYLKLVRPNLVKDKTQTILVNDRGHSASRVDVWRWLAAWSKKAGFEDVIGPHQFRHGCATALLENGADLRSIQMLLGHSSLQTTQIYTTVANKKLRDEVEKLHPLSSSEDSEIR